LPLEMEIQLLWFANLLRQVVTDARLPGPYVPEMGRRWRTHGPQVQPDDAGLAQVDPEVSALQEISPEALPCPPVRRRPDGWRR